MKQRLLAGYRHVRRYFAPLFETEFRPSLYALLMVILPSSILLPLTTFYPEVYTTLSDSRTTPWGVVTSIFIHSGTLHLAGNMGLLFFLILLFVKLHAFSSANEKHSRSIFLLWNIFVSGTIANMLFILLSTGSSAGASGVVFACEGVLMGFALSMALPDRINLRTIRDHFSGKEARKRAIPGAVTFLALFLFLLLFPKEFLSYGPGVNVFAHGVAFYISFVSVIAWGIVGSRKSHP